MDDLASSEELAFIPEQVEPILWKVIEDVIKPVAYNEDHVQGWIDTICDRALKELADLQKPYKYIVTCQIIQKNGAGLHTAHSCYWNREDDNLAIVSWPNDKVSEQSEQLRSKNPLLN
tara:strand:+ start:43 stop:396 length:354 start_codon:yes stop_codon:yes gene_type:complete